MTTWKIGRMTLSNGPKSWTPTFTRSSKDQIYEGRSTTSVGTMRPATVIFQATEIFTSYANKRKWIRQMREQMDNNDLQPVWVDGEAEYEGWYTIESFLPKDEAAKTTSCAYRLRLKEFGNNATHQKKITVESRIIPNPWAVAYPPVVGIPVSSTGSLPEYETRTSEDGSVPVMKIGEFFEIEDGNLLETDTAGDDAFGGSFVRSDSNSIDGPFFKASSALPLSGAYVAYLRCRCAATLTPASYTTGTANEYLSWNETDGAIYTAKNRVFYKQHAYFPTTEELLAFRGYDKSAFWTAIYTVQFGYEQMAAASINVQSQLLGIGDEVRKYNRTRQTVKTEDYATSVRFSITGPANSSAIICNAKLTMNISSTDANAKTNVIIYLLGPAGGVDQLDDVTAANAIRADAPTVKATMEGSGDQVFDVTPLVQYAVNHPEFTQNDYVGFKIDSGTLSRAINTNIAGDAVSNSDYQFTQDANNTLDITYIDNPINLWAKSTSGMASGKIRLNAVDNVWDLLPLGTTLINQGDDYYIYVDQDTADNFDLDCAILVPAKPVVVRYDATEPVSGTCSVLDGSDAVYSPSHVFAGELQASNGLIRITTETAQTAKGRLKIEAYISASWTTLGYYRIYDHTDSVDYGGQTPQRIQLLKLSDQIVQFALFFDMNTTSKMTGIFTLKFGQWNLSAYWIGGAGEMDHLIDLNGTTWLARISDNTEYGTAEAVADAEDDDAEKPYFYCTSTSDYSIGFNEIDNGDRFLDAVWQVDDVTSPSGVTWVNITGNVQNRQQSIAQAVFGATSTDYGILFGSRRPFEYLRFNVDTVAVNLTTAWQFWTGSAWSALTIDEDNTGSTGDGTDSFDTLGEGVIEFTVPAWGADHAETDELPDVGEPMYWIRCEATFAGNGDVDPKIDYVLKTGRRRWGDDIATDDYYTLIYRRRGGRSINIFVNEDVTYADSTQVNTQAANGNANFNLTTNQWSGDILAGQLGGVSYNGYMRFPIDVSYGKAATVLLNIYLDASGGAPTFKIQLINDVTCDAFPTGAGDETAYPVTATEVNWSPSGTGWKTLDITTLYNAYILMSGFASGDYMGIKIFHNNVADINYINAGNWGANPPYLTITHASITDAGVERIIESLNDYQVTEFIEER